MGCGLSNRGPVQPYLLGHSQVEERRLRMQAEELREESASLFDRIGICAGSRAIDLGCGPHGCWTFCLSALAPLDR